MRAFLAALLCLGPAGVAGADATLGICAAAPGAGGTADVEDALARGCAAEALARIRALLPTARPEQVPMLGFLAAEGRLAALAEGFDDLSPGVPNADPYHAAWLFPDGKARTPVDDVDEVGVALVRGALPVELHTSGRFARLLVRSLPTYSCLRTINRGTDDQVRLQARQLFTALVKRYGFDGGKGPAHHVERARALLWTCADVKAVVKELLTAADLHDKAQQPLEAAAVELRAWEAVFFPGGRAGDLLLVEANPDFRAKLAARTEAARRGVGTTFVLGTKLEQSAAVLLRSGATRFPPALRSRFYWLRAAGALRLRNDARAAVKLAGQAVRDAVLAKGADLLDAARTVLALAGAELGRWEATGQIFAALSESFRLRGVPGAREKVARLVENAAATYAVVGRGDAAIELLRRAAPIADGLAPFSWLRHSGALQRLLYESGRREDALDALTELERRVRERAAAIDPVVLSQMQQILGQNRQLLESGLGRGPKLGTSAPERMAQAIQDGDEGSIRAILGSAKETDATALHAGLLAAGFCRFAAVHGGAVADLISQGVSAIREAASRPNAGNPLELGMERAKMSVSGVEAGLTLVSCGMGTGDGALAARGRSLIADAAALVGGADPVYTAYAEAVALDVAGRAAEASQRYAEIGRRLMTRAGVSGQSGMGLAQSAAPYFGAAVDAALRQEPPDVARAVALREESTARDLRAARSGGLGGGDAEALLALERDIANVNQRIRALVTLLAGSPEPDVQQALAAERADLEKNVEALEQQRDAAARALRDSAPQLYRAAALGPPPTLAEIRGWLRDDEVLLYYVVSVESGWALLVDQAGARAVRLYTTAPGALAQAPLRLAELRRRLRRAVAAKQAGRGVKLVERAQPASPKPTALSHALEEVHKLLVAPIEPFVPAGRRIAIVPDASTAMLPFAALGAADRPWIARNPLRVVPGAHLLADARRSLARGEALVVGAPEFGDVSARRASARGAAASGDWQELPGTRDEASAVAALYETKPLLGRDASEERVREGLRSARVIHLATHGLADVARPAYSAVILSSPPTGSADDGILHAYEIERVRSSADLVVLSACQTGEGQGRGAEGVLALDRAFLVAGAGAVVSSLWVVDDTATAALMTELHKAIRAGRPVDVALAGAMNAVRARKAEWAHPYFWSAFRVVGGGVR